MIIMSELIENYARRFWEEWKKLPTWFPKEKWEKIYSDKDNTSWSSNIFSFLINIAGKLNLEYLREKKRNDFTMKTCDGQLICHIEHENYFRKNWIIQKTGKIKKKPFERLANSPYPLKIFIGYTTNENKKEDWIFFNDEVKKYNSPDKKLIWMNIIAFGKKGFVPDNLSDWEGEYWLNTQKSEILK